MKISFNLPLTILKEKEKFIAYSPAIDLSTSSNNFEEVHKRFMEAASLFFEEINNKKTTNEVLEDLGWQKIDEKWFPPVVVAQESEVVSVSG